MCNLSSALLLYLIFVRCKQARFAKNWCHVLQLSSADRSALRKRVHASAPDRLKVKAFVPPARTPARKRRVLARGAHPSSDPPIRRRRPGRPRGRSLPDALAPAWGPPLTHLRRPGHRLRGCLPASVPASAPGSWSARRPVGRPAGRRARRAVSRGGPEGGSARRGGRPFVLPAGALPPPCPTARPAPVAAVGGSLRRPRAGCGRPSRPRSRKGGRGEGWDLKWEGARHFPSLRRRLAGSRRPCRSDRKREEGGGVAGRAR